MILALLAALALPARAETVDHESWKALGWGSHCNVAVEWYAYPRIGEAIQDEPIWSRVGTLVVPPGSDVPQVDWRWNTEGRLTWKRSAISELEKTLRSEGYRRPGFPETVRENAMSEGVASVLLSSSSLKARMRPWPGAEWRLSGIDYSPLSTCALLVFERRDAPRRYELALARLDDPGARVDRALAHVENAHLMLEAGDLEGALAEAQNGAKAAPEKGSVRYHHARLLSLSGRADEAVAELGAALKQSPRLRDEAREELDFEGLRERPDFQRLLAPPAAP